MQPDHGARRDRRPGGCARVHPSEGPTKHSCADGLAMPFSLCRRNYRPQASYLCGGRQSLGETRTWAFRRPHITPRGTGRAGPQRRRPLSRGPPPSPLRPAGLRGSDTSRTQRSERLSRGKKAPSCSETFPALSTLRLDAASFALSTSARTALPLRSLADLLPLHAVRRHLLPQS